MSQANLEGCAPQFCYIDHIDAWSTNELTINWNSALAWVSAFVTDQGEAAPPTASACEVDYTVHGAWESGFTTQVTIRNTGDEPVDGWELGWSFTGGQSVGRHWSGDLEQSGPRVTTRDLDWNAAIDPGEETTFGFVGTRSGGSDAAPELFRLNGAVCG